MRANSERRPSGFTLIELLVVIMIIVLLIGILLPALSKARASGRFTICMTNLQQQGVATHSYTADFQDKIYSFTITQATRMRLSYADLQAQAAGTDLAAASAQAIDIIRRRTSRDSGPTMMPVITLWIPHVLYSHLVLQDYLASRLPEKLVVCPEDRNRTRWQNWQQFNANAFAPLQPNGTVQANWRWPYSTSYQIVPAAYSNDSIKQGSTVMQATSHSTYQQVGNPLRQNELGKRKLFQVMFPSQKVQLYEDEARHYRKQYGFYAADSSNIPVLHFDQHAGMAKSAEMLWGFNPGAPRGGPTFMTYTPQPWEAPSPAGSYRGKCRWTRAGLQGVDFGTMPNSEVSTANW
jgi:prepilin-type N-terminal cleavage/methylation domain-containing protein